jgi:hypothetical protein
VCVVWPRRGSTSADRRKGEGDPEAGSTRDGGSYARSRAVERAIQSLRKLAGAKVDRARAGRRDGDPKATTGLVRRIPVTLQPLAPSRADGRSVRTREESLRLEPRATGRRTRRAGRFRTSNESPRAGATTSGRPPARKEAEGASERPEPNEVPRPMRDEKLTSATPSQGEAAASTPPVRTKESFIWTSSVWTADEFFVRPAVESQRAPSAESAGGKVLVEGSRPPQRLRPKPFSTGRASIGVTRNGAMHFDSPRKVLFSTGQASIGSQGTGPCTLIPKESSFPHSERKGPRLRGAARSAGQRG